MKSRALGLALGLAVAAAPAAAGAQTFLSEPYRQPGESRQDLAFELRAGSWTPNLASGTGANGRNAFNDYFLGEGAQGGPLIGLGGEVDWQILRMGPVGSLGVGLQAYIGWVSARAPLSASTSNADPATWTRTEQQTALTAVPVSALGVVRFDGLARAFRYLPLVPYVKFGLTYGFWWVTNGAAYARGTNAAGMQADAVGGSLGWTGAVGLQVMLDAFEPTLARQFDTTMGVNHSYVFVEGFTQNLGFGDPTRLDVGTLTWCAGLAFEY